MLFNRESDCIGDIMMRMLSQAQKNSDRPLSHWSTIREKFNIFRGKANSRRSCSGESTLLPVQYLVYETLVNGISTAVHEKDFQGVMGIDYEMGNEQYHIVFAMWYSKFQHLYFLSSLGQYSTSAFNQGMAQFKKSHEYRLKIKLAPIHTEGLANLREKLLRSNLSGANVCIIEDTLANKA